VSDVTLTEGASTDIYIPHLFGPGTPQAPDAEGEFGPARCTTRAIQGGGAGIHQPAMSSRSLTVLAFSGFLASLAMLI